MQPVWWPEPVAGELVWCHFPHLPASQPGPKPRPALVIEVKQLASGRTRVLVAYGTSKKLTALRAGEFVINRQNSAAYALSGLGTDTKFCLQTAVELDFNSDWFKPPPLKPFGDNPKLGLLHPSLSRSAALAWVAIQT